MRHLYANRFGLAAAVTLGVVVASPRVARADVVIFEKDAWSVWTSGRSAAHYQFILGGGTPTPSAPGVVLTGFRNDAATDENNNIATSRIRSGWVGTQLGIGVANQLTPTTKVKAFFAVSVADITNDREKTADKGVDFREAWTTIEGSFGTVKFGRALSIFGPALAGSVYMYSYGNAVGHPCTIDGQAITCGPINAGAIYPGFNAQLTYATPNLNGFGAKIGLFDPSLPSLADGTYPYTLRPLPRVEGELSYEYGGSTIPWRRPRPSSPMRWAALARLVSKWPASGSEAGIGPARGSAPACHSNRARRSIPPANCAHSRGTWRTPTT